MYFSDDSLLQIPQVPMRNILEYLDFPSIQSLRKTCHDLCNIIDDTKPDPSMKNVLLEIESSESISLILNFNESSELYPDGKRIDLEYQKHGSGEKCLVTWNRSDGENKKIIDEDFVATCVKDLGIMLKNQKSVLEWLKIIYNYSNPDELLEPLITEFSNSLQIVLKFLSLQTNGLRMMISEQSQIMSVLPYINSKSLNEIWITDSKKRNQFLLEIDGIVELDQWKSAKDLCITDFVITTGMKNLLHFSIVDVTLEKLCSDHIGFLKEKFLLSSTAKQFEICYKDFDDQDQLTQVIDTPLEDTNYWIIKTPENLVTIKLNLHFMKARIVEISVVNK